MQTEHNVDLSKKVTFRIGGIAENFYIPESVEDLKELVIKLGSDNKYYILSGGSNLIINDSKKFENVIFMGKTDTSIEDNGNGCFYAGASVRIQKLLSAVNEKGYGGFEELVGLPALMGGIIYMNAGIGGRTNAIFNIADFVKRVKVIDKSTAEIKWINHDDCGFDYRTSVFQKDNYIILGVELQLNEQSKEESDMRIKKRKEYCKQNQEWGKGCFGTCFCKSSKKILKFVGTLHLHKGGVRQAKNNNNWLVNDGSGTYADAMWIINLCKKLHKLFNKKIRCEVIIWD